MYKHKTLNKQKILVSLKKGSDLVHYKRMQSFYTTHPRVPTKLIFFNESAILLGTSRLV